MFRFILLSPISRYLIYLFGLAYLVLITWNNQNETDLSHTLSVIPITTELLGRFLPITSILVCVTIMVLISKINSLHRFSEKSTFIIGLFFFFVFSSYPEAVFNLNNVLSTLFIILSLMIMLNIYNQPSVKGLVFLSSLLISFASILFFPACLFLAILYITIGIFRPFDLRNIIMVMIAFLIPYLYLFGIGYLFDFNVSIPFITALEVFESTGLNHSSVWGSAIIPLIGNTVILIYAILKSFSLKQFLVVRQRNQLSIILYSFLLAILFLILYGIENSIALLMATGSLFVLLLYNSVKYKWLIDVLFLVLFSISIVIQFFLQ